MYHRVIRKTTLPFALLVVSAAAFAGGSHADGHGASAIGEPGQADRVTRTISVDMTDDMRFSTPVIAVQQGETIRFKARNSGQVKHEMVLGTPQELKEHYAMMLKMPGMEHADANMVGVAPGKTGEVIWHFTQAGKVDFACLQPGHYDAGMKGMVTVASAAPSKADAHGSHRH
jgi:uncharacterized cupredoxin-like copper-binding protein